MTAHVVVRSLGPEPATVSAVRRALREELSFDGLVVSDALDMRAIAGTIGVEDGAVRALAAGVDALCLGPAVGPEGVAAVRDAIVAAVEARTCRRSALPRPRRASSRPDFVAQSH